MQTNKNITKKINKQVNALKNKIEHRNLYNIRNFVVRTIIKSGFFIDYMVPFFLASFLAPKNPLFQENPPFQIDNIQQEASIETIDTSSGIHTEKITYDFKFDNEILEYSTGWIINDKGLYERTVTTYRINKKIDLDDTESILAMSKEELEELMSISNIEKITKSILTDDDYIFNEAAIIITNHIKSDKYIITRKENKKENAMNTIFYFLYYLGLVEILKSIKNAIVKINVSDKLKMYEVEFIHLSKDDLKEMRRIIKLREENLALVSDNAKSFQYKLRKDIRG